MLQNNPKLLLERSRGVTPYQYALCAKDMRAVKMIGPCFNLDPALEGAKLSQVMEYLSRKKNKEVEALRVHFEAVFTKTKIAYKFYFKKVDWWYTPQCRDYWSRVIGRLQNEWPAQWRQELCYPDRYFDEETKFTSDEALPQAKFADGVPWLPGRDDGGEISLIIVAPNTPLDSIKDFWVKPTLIKQGDQYYIYTPQIPEDKELEKAVEWKSSPIPEEALDKLLNELRVALLDEEEKSESMKADLKKQAEESNLPVLINQAGNLSIYGRNESGVWVESKLDGYDEKIFRANISLAEEGVTTLSKERCPDIFKFIKKHHTPLPFPPMGQTKDLFISPLRHRLLHESLRGLAFQVSLGVGSGIDFAAYNYGGAGAVPGGREGHGRWGVPWCVLPDLAGLAGLYKTETNELKAELETTLRDQKKLNG